MDENFLKGRVFDTVLADYLIGAIDGFAPYFQVRQCYSFWFDKQKSLIFCQPQRSTELLAPRENTSYYPI